MCIRDSHHTRPLCKKADASCFPVWPDYIITSISQTFGKLTIPDKHSKLLHQVALTCTDWQYVCVGSWTDLQTADAKTLRQLAMQIDNWLDDSVAAVVWEVYDLSKADNFMTAEDIMARFYDASKVSTHAVQIKQVSYAQDDTKPHMILVDTLLGHDPVWVQLNKIMCFMGVKVQAERGWHSGRDMSREATARRVLGTGIW